MDAMAAAERRAAEALRDVKSFTDIQDEKTFEAMGKSREYA
jgi:hypothetical protein